jgi:hypothetical protein
MKYLKLYSVIINFFFLCIYSHSESLPVNKNILEKKEIYLQIAVEKNTGKNLFEKKYIYQEDYSWDYSFEEVGGLFQEIYESGKQLPHPVYYNSNKSSFMMPVNDSCELPVSWDFIFSIICHIEQALENKVADYIFLPDMGHGHFFLPENNNLFLSDDFSDEQVFTAILSSKNVKILYHTAEMFLFFGPKKEFYKLSLHEQFRNKTRNLLGSFYVCDTMISYISYQFGSPVVNSIGPDYRRVAQDIDISASINGAFPFTFKGELYYFDISRYSPQCKRIN